jgi:hypothetical protein
MKIGLRFILAGVCSTVGLALACGGSTNGGGGSSACDDYFDAIYSTNCGIGVTLPASELSRVKPRFEQLCASVIALPGVSVTTGNLEACAAAVKSSGCGVFQSSQPGGACSFSAGAESSGAPCISGDQCQSGDCSAGSSSVDAGTSACGACGAVIGVGQACSGSCGMGETCVFSATGGTCQTVTYVGAGASCDSSATQCNSGLFCGPSGKCAAPGPAGTACNTAAQCQAPLVCPTATGPGTCQSPGQAGATCSGDEDCVSSLGCDVNAHTCGTPSWVSAGQPCSGNVRCLVGSCPYDSTAQMVNGTCPTVIADGQPCTEDGSSTSTCDTFAECLGGTCLLTFSGVCP